MLESHVIKKNLTHVIVMSFIKLQV